MYCILQFMDNTIYSRVTYLYTTLTCVHSDILAPTPTLTCSLSPLICLLTQLWHIHFPTSDMLGLTALTCSLSPLWRCGFAGSKLLAGEYSLSALTISLRREQAVSGGSGFARSKLVAVECSLSPLTIWLRSEQSVSGGSGFAGSKLVAVECSLSPLTISLGRGQAVSGGSGFAGSSGMLALTSDNLASQGASC